jgi:peptidyl-tRNA hydrolase
VICQVTIVHYDSELELGKYTMAFGGRTRNNEALKIAAAALKEEGFGRLGLGVAKGQLFEG